MLDLVVIHGVLFADLLEKVFHTQQTVADPQLPEIVHPFLKACQRLSQLPITDSVSPAFAYHHGSSSSNITIRNGSASPTCSYRLSTPSLPNTIAAWTSPCASWNAIIGCPKLFTPALIAGAGGPLLGSGHRHDLPPPRCRRPRHPRHLLLAGLNDFLPVRLTGHDLRRRLEGNLFQVRHAARQRSRPGP